MPARCKNRATVGPATPQPIISAFFLDWFILASSFSLLYACCVCPKTDLAMRSLPPTVSQRAVRLRRPLSYDPGSAAGRTHSSGTHRGPHKSAVALVSLQDQQAVAPCLRRVDRAPCPGGYKAPVAHAACERDVWRSRWRQ